MHHIVHHAVRYAGYRATKHALTRGAYRLGLIHGIFGFFILGLIGGFVFWLWYRRKN